MQTYHDDCSYHVITSSSSTWEIKLKKPSCNLETHVEVLYGEYVCQQESSCPPAAALLFACTWHPCPWMLFSAMFQCQSPLWWYNLQVDLASASYLFCRHCKLLWAEFISNGAATQIYVLPRGIDSILVNWGMIDMRAAWLEGIRTGEPLQEYKSSVNDGHVIADNWEDQHGSTKRVYNSTIEYVFFGWCISCVRLPGRDGGRGPLYGPLRGTFGL